MPNYGSQAADSHGWSLGGVCGGGTVSLSKIPSPCRGLESWQPVKVGRGADARLAVSFDIFQGGGDSDNYRSLASPFGQR